MKQWIERLKKEPPSWRLIRAVHVVAAIVIGGLAVIADNRWIALVDAGIAGFNVAGIFHATTMIRMGGAFDKMKEAFDQVAEINSALINGHMTTVVMEMHRRDNDGDAPPIAPKLH